MLRVNILRARVSRWVRVSIWVRDNGDWKKKLLIIFFLGVLKKNS